MADPNNGLFSNLGKKFMGGLSGQNQNDSLHEEASADKDGKGTEKRTGVASIDDYRQRNEWESDRHNYNYMKHTATLLLEEVLSEQKIRLEAPDKSSTTSSGLQKPASDAAAGAGGTTITPPPSDALDGETGEKASETVTDQSFTSNVWTPEMVQSSKRFLVDNCPGWSDETDINDKEMLRLAAEHLKREKELDEEYEKRVKEEMLHELRKWGPLPPPNTGQHKVAGKMSDTAPPANLKWQASVLSKANTKPIASLPPPPFINQQRVHPNQVKPIVGSTFAPPYCSNMLRNRPHLAPGLHHVNCSYLTARTRPRSAGGSGRTFEGHGINADAPSLGELKQHVQSLLYLIKNLGFSTSAAEIDAELRVQQRSSNPSVDRSFANPGQTANVIADQGVFDFLHNLDKPYQITKSYDKIPLTNLLNTVEWRDDHSEMIVDVCPLIRNTAEAINRKQHPMPFERIEALMAHADSALMMIDDALNASGGLLSALPMNLPASDHRRQTYLGQMIHFMRVMVSRVAALDKAYGSALDTLAGEATIPKFIQTNLLKPEEMKTAFAEYQQQYILTNIQPETYSQIWYEMQKKGALKAENNGYGLYDVYIPTRYRGLVGGKTVFITPDPSRIGEGLAGEQRNIDRPLVIAVRKPGPATDTSEWLRKHTAELEEARDWKERGILAERLVEQLKRDIDYLTPEVVLEETPGDRTVLTATDAWDRVTRREEALRAKLMDRAMYAKRNRELEARNMRIEQENDQLKRWKDAERIGRSENKSWEKENILLKGYLVDTLEQLHAKKEEAIELEEIILNKKEEADFEVADLKKKHAVRVAMLENQISIELDRNTMGAKMVDHKLAIANTQLKQQLHEQIEMNNAKWKTIHALEEKVKKINDDDQQRKFLELQYEHLSKRHEDMLADWSDQYLKFGKVKPNLLHKVRGDLDEAKAELEDQKKQNKRLVNQIDNLKILLSNFHRNWEDHSRKSGDRTSWQLYLEHREQFFAELDLLLKKNEKLEKKLDEQEEHCKQKQESLEDLIEGTKHHLNVEVEQNAKLRQKIFEWENMLGESARAKRQLELKATKLEQDIMGARMEARRVAIKCTDILKEETQRHVDDSHKFVEYYNILVARYERAIFELAQNLFTTGPSAWEGKTDEEVFKALEGHLNADAGLRVEEVQFDGLDFAKKDLLKDSVKYFEQLRDEYVAGRQLLSLDERLKKLEAEKEALKSMVDRDNTTKEKLQKLEEDKTALEKRFNEESKVATDAVVERGTYLKRWVDATAQIEELTAEKKAAEQKVFELQRDLRVNKKMQSELGGKDKDMNFVHDTLSNALTEVENKIKQIEDLKKEKRACEERCRQQRLETTADLEKVERRNAWFEKYVTSLGNVWEEAIPLDEHFAKLSDYFINYDERREERRGMKNPA